MNFTKRLIKASLLDSILITDDEDDGKRRRNSNDKGTVVNFEGKSLESDRFILRRDDDGHTLSTLHTPSSRTRPTTDLGSRSHRRRKSDGNADYENHWKNYRDDYWRYYRAEVDDWRYGPSNGGYPSYSSDYFDDTTWTDDACDWGDERECNKCGVKTTNQYWCDSCSSFRFKQDFDKWTSENKDVDEFIQKAQLEATSRFKTIEWIPFENFSNIKKIGEGGFSKVYSAEWKEGYILYLRKNDQWQRSGDVKVALKCLKNSTEISKEYLEVIKSLHKLSNDESQITRCYGITKDEASNFVIVMKFVDHTKAIHEKSWEEKFALLHYTALGLFKIHEVDLIHRDFHLGNVLFSNENDAVYITDLGLCKPANYKEKVNKLYGVLPYVAPEVLRNKIHTKAADIYSFGMIMYEVISGNPPYKDVDCSDEVERANLAIRVCDGERPEIQGLPPLIVELLKKCWDADPAKRIAAKDLGKILYAWRRFRPDSELGKQINASEVNQPQQSTSRTSEMNQTQQSTGRSSEQINTSQLTRTSKLLNYENLSPLN